MSNTVLNAVSERRLRPIYELLDNGNYKKAFHETEKVLKKQKDLLAAKVLKTIALHRMGKEEEAFLLSNEIIVQEPTDENSLQGLSLYYKEIQKSELICPLYENAVRLCPGNEEYLSHLFMAYVRHEKFQQMQRVAMLLFKQHPKNPYLFWGIMAIVLQAENASDRNLAKKMYLPLAEKMIEKHVNNGRIEAEAEVKLYLMILDLLGKHEKALEVANGELGEMLTCDIGGRSAMILEIQEKLSNWEFANNEHKKLLKENPSVWNYAVGYLDSLFHLLDKDGKSEAQNDLNSCSENSTRLQEEIQFIINLVTEENALLEWKRRGPYLLRLEMLKRMKERFGDDDQETCFGPAKQLLLEYALDFSPKPFCFSDLKPYFSLLHNKKQFLTQLNEQQSSLTSTGWNGDCDESLKNEISKKKIKEIQRHIFTIEAARYLGEHDLLSIKEKHQLAIDFLNKHEAGLKHVANRPPTDPCPVDPYCVMTGRILMDLYAPSGDTGFLWRCAYVLEHGLEHSKYNYEMKIMLIRVYCTLGAFSPCADLYDSMEIKHMQQDTLGYTVCRHVVSLGHFQHASQVFQMARNFYINNNKESLECLIACFRNGTFYKVSEFVKYRRRIHNSYHSAFVRTEHLLMDIFTQGDIDQPVTGLLGGETPRIDYDVLVDNRDLRVVGDTNPSARQITDAMIKQSFEDEKMWLRFRELLLHSICSVLRKTSEDHRSNVHNGCSCHGPPDQLAPLVSEFEVFCSSLKQPKEDANPIHGPCGTRMKLAIEAQYPTIMILLFKFSGDFLGLKSNPESENSSSILGTLTTTVKLLQDYLSTCKEEIYSNTSHSDIEALHKDQSTDVGLNLPIPETILNINTSVIERLVLCTEMFSICVLLVCRLKSVVSEVKMNAQRKKRRKKGKQATTLSLPTWVADYHASVASFSDIGGQLVSGVSRIKTDVETSMLDVGKLKLDNGTEQGSDSQTEHEKPEHEKAENIANSTNTVNDGIYKRITNNALDSYIVSCKQLLFVLEGRMKNLKEAAKV